MVLPPVIPGFLLLLLLGSQGIVGKWFAPVVIELDADRGGIQVALAAPIGLSRVPCAAAFVDQLEDFSIAPDEEYSVSVR